MKPEDIITDEFLKQFKTGKELNDFLAQIQKRGIEKMLETDFAFWIRISNVIIGYFFKLF